MAAVRSRTGVATAVLVACSIWLASAATETAQPVQMEQCALSGWAPKCPGKLQRYQKGTNLAPATVARCTLAGVTLDPGAVKVHLSCSKELHRYLSECKEGRVLQNLAVQPVENRADSSSDPELASHSVVATPANVLQSHRRLDSLTYDDLLQTTRHDKAEIKQLRRAKHNLSERMTSSASHLKASNLSIIRLQQDQHARTAAHEQEVTALKRRLEEVEHSLSQVTMERR